MKLYIQSVVILLSIITVIVVIQIINTTNSRPTSLTATVAKKEEIIKESDVDWPITIRFSHIVTENTPKGQMANRFKDLVEERIGNQKIIVEVYPNKELYGDNEVVDAILEGKAEMAAPAMSKLKRFTPKLQLLDLPFIFGGANDAYRFLAGPYSQELLHSMDDKGVRGLGFLNNGMKQLSSTRKLKVPQDAEGLKFRIMNSDVLQSQFESMGAIGVRKPFSEVYELLASQELDGQENTWSNIDTKKFYEHQPYIMDSNHGYLGYMVLTSTKFWNGIPTATRQQLEEILAESLEYGNQIAREKELTDRQDVINKGVSEVYTISDADRLKWVEAMSPIWKRYESEIGRDLLQAAAGME